MSDSVIKWLETHAAVVRFIRDDVHVELNDDTAIVAASLAGAYRKWLMREKPAHEYCLCGGRGCHRCE